MTLLLNLTNCDHDGKRYAIEQGAVFDKVTLLHERNLTGWAPKGQIRTNYADRGGVLLEEFSFDPIEYQSVLICGNPRMRSVIKPRLTRLQTLALGKNWVTLQMVNRRLHEPVIIGRNAWVYDIEISQALVSERLTQGMIEIDLEVTNG